MLCKQEVRFKAHDPKAYSKGGTLENTINGARGPPPPAPAPQPDEEAGPPPHLLHASKVFDICSCILVLRRNMRFLLCICFV